MEEELGAAWPHLEKFAPACSYQQKTPLFLESAQAYYDPPGHFLSSNAASSFDFADSSDHTYGIMSVANPCARTQAQT